MEAAGDDHWQQGDTDQEPLPTTCTVLEKNAEKEVYVIGTAHFSRESQEDVAKVIRRVQPHVVFLELCSSRLGILQLNEETLLEEAKDVGYHKLQQAIKKSGLVQGVMHMLLVSMSAKLTEKLGMAPGGEFRRAYQEAQRIPHCRVVYGDRPIGITMSRAISSLSFIQKIRFAWHIITSDMNLTEADIEKCKQKDMLEQLLAEMAGTFPSITTVFVDERDIFLAHTLKRSSNMRPEAVQQRSPTKVVAVLGIGHVTGVTKNWDMDLSEAVKETVKIPPPSLSGRIISGVARGALLGVTLYASYRISKRGYSLIQSHIMPRFK